MKLVKNVFMVLALLGSGYASANFSEIQQLTAPDDKAIIFFYRTGRVGGAVKFHVHKPDGTAVGYLGKSGDSFSIEVAPGSHQFWSRAASRNDVSLTVEAGQVYYVKATVKVGLAVGRPVLEQVRIDQVPQ
ncbi:hypothetical protein [Litorilituus lipolyticus]|uniref:DUF2846 domain-containing protein n=1 Tax=Litorilituus lipolyticus TaxID=2491017 RepID=A0A502L6D9_9GAMM|nr:hypothetical protein [Litorilituus lipolyticus]TPH18015.1 hypothetical protein EPA86_02550 [Litorilituus lipolyticus]